MLIFYHRSQGNSPVTFGEQKSGKRKSFSEKSFFYESSGRFNETFCPAMKKEKGFSSLSMSAFRCGVTLGGRGKGKLFAFVITKSEFSFNVCTHKF